MKNEKWKDIKNYEGQYQVSNFGRVKSLKYGKEKILSAGKNKSGYLQVVLGKNKKLSCKYIHRLVAEAFLPNPNNLSEINHKDEDKTLNIVWVNEDGTIDPEKSNLEWCNRVYNVNYGTGIKRSAQNRQKPVVQMTLDGQIVKTWSSMNEAQKNGFDIGAVSRCCNKIWKTHKGYKWKYL